MIDLEHTLTQWIRWKNKPLYLKGLLKLFRRCYQALLVLRHVAYDLGVLRSYALGAPVISIGNIAAGGTGKTPVVILLTQALQSKVRVAVLTRGFRSDLVKKGGAYCVASGEGPLYAAQECGDEPYLLAKSTKSAVWVGKNRVQSGQCAILQGAECLLLDDGMQHRRLKRDIDIAVIDGTEPFSQERLFPEGLLRDLPSRLRAVDYVIINHCKSKAHFEEAKKQINPYTQAPCIGMQVQVENRDQFGSQEKVGVFCGIGQPWRFIDTIQSLEQEVVCTLFIKDHGFLSSERLYRFAYEALERGAKRVVCTEKDAVKLSHLSGYPLPIVPVRIQLDICAGHAHWDALLQNILLRVKHE